MTIRLATIDLVTRHEIIGSESVWSAVNPNTAVSAVLWDVQQGDNKIEGDYFERLSNWLTSGDELMYLEIDNENGSADLWTVGE